MYCVKCGVELGDSEKHCPLCSTPVYYPGRGEGGERPYPEFKKPETANPKGIYFIVSFFFFIAAVISFFCDINLGGGISWSGFVIGGVIVTYEVFVLPRWFSRKHPEIFCPAFFLLSGLFLLYINYATGGEWFLTLALPLVGAGALVICPMAILYKYVKNGHLYIWGGVSVALGLIAVLTEYLISLTFNHEFRMVWSPYPLITLFLIGIMLIVIAIVKPFKDSLRRIFNI